MQAQRFVLSSQLDVGAVGPGSILGAAGAPGGGCGQSTSPRQTHRQTDLSQVSPRGERFQPMTPLHLSWMRALQGGGPGWWTHGGHMLGRGGGLRDPCLRTCHSAGDSGET